MKKNRLIAKIGLLMSFILLFGLAHGQVKFNESYRYDYFKKIGNTENLIYTFNGIPKVYDKQELTFFNGTGKKLSSIQLQSKQGLVLVNTVKLGEHSLFYFTYNLQKRVLLLLVDKEGKEVKRHDMEYPKVFHTKVVALTDNTFCMVSDIKVKKWGLKVECYDTDFNQKWVYEDIPEKSKYYLEDAAANSKGELGLVFTEKSTNYKVLMLDATGNKTGQKDINTDKLSKYTPYKVEFLNDDDFAVVADYGETTNQVFAQTSTGVSVKVFNKTGEEIINKSLLFNAVQEKMGDRLPNGTLAYKEAPALRVLDIKDINGAYTLICESYFIKEQVIPEKTSSTATAPTNVTYGTINLLDFYTLRLDNLEDMHRIWKPQRAVTIRGVNSYFGYKGYCGLLEDHNMFSYQGIINNEMLVRGYSQNYEYYNKIPLDKQYGNTLTRVYWGNPVSKERPRQNSSKLVFKSGVNDITGGINHNGFFHTTAGIVLYHYHTQTNNLQFTVLN